MAEENRTDKFVLAEYAAIREEIKWIIGQIETLESTTLIFSGAIWAWVAAQTWKPIYIAVVSLPFVLSLLFLIKRESLRRSLREAAEYSMKIESYFDLHKDMGWDRHLKSKGIRHFRFWKIIFWTVLILFNLSMALWMILCSQ